ncbi:MAG TPA: YIP1 family protein [Pyrinomonadaceae bacterium]|nr:YIP1 family protein [Pyrinomonadaceae bacterium]
MSASNELNFQPPPPPPMPKEEPQAPRPTKLRIAGIVIFVLGVLIVIGGAAKFVAGGLSTGGMLCLVGVILVGLSFVRLPAVPEKEGPLSFGQKLTGIFFEPSRVFRNLREHPQWLGAFIILCALTAAYNFAFIQRITPERVVDHTIQKLSEMGPPFAPPPAQLEAMKTQQLQSFKNPTERVGAFIKSFVMLYIVAAIVAGISMLGILIFGGRINFWQSLAVTMWAWLPPVLIQKVLGLVILYLKSPDDLHPILNQETMLQDNLGILLSPAEHPVLFVIASLFGLTSFYLVWLRAKGLHLGATRASSSAGWGVAILIFVLTLIMVTIFTALFSNFIS